MTLGSAAAAGVRLIVWRWDCRHQVEPDPAAKCGPGTVNARLPREAGMLAMRQPQGRMVVTGTERR